MLLKISFILLTIAVIIGLLVIGFKAIDKTFLDTAKAKKKKIWLVTGLILWQIYTFAIASTGILESFELPPRFPMLLIFPLFLFTGIFIYKNRNNAWIKNIKPSTLIYFQTFRILMETLFVLSVTAGILHKNVSIEGYNMDMAFAFTAPIIGYLVFYKKRLSKKALIYWNYLGLLVLASVIVVFVTTIYAPSFYGYTEPIMPMASTKYPYILVAGFLMPVAVFIHVLSIVQLGKK